MSTNVTPAIHGRYYSVRFGTSGVLHTEFGGGLTLCGKRSPDAIVSIDQPPTCKACARRTELT